MAFTDKVIDGGDILLSVNGLIVACATSHSIELTNAVREISCKGSGDFTSAEYGRFSWTASTDALMNLGKDSAMYVSYTNLMELMSEKVLINIDSFYMEGTDSISIKGQCIITSINQTAGDSENASYSVSLQGRGGIQFQEGFKLNTPVLDPPTMTSSTANLDWTDVNDIPNEFGINLEYSIDGVDWILAKILSTDSIAGDVTGLQPSTKYLFRVKALGDTNIVDSNYSNVVSGTTLA